MFGRWGYLMSTDDPQPESGESVPPSGDGVPREPRTDISWMAPDPPPIPDRIQNAVNPKLPSLPALPAIPKVQVNRRWLKRGIAAAAIAVVALGVWLALPGEGLAEADRQRWEALCDEHAAWFGPFAASLEYEDKAVLEDVGLGEVVTEVGAASRYAPQTIAQSPDASTDQLRSHPPEILQQAGSIAATKQAVQSIARVDQAFAQWPTARALRDQQAHFRAHGWDHAADVIQHHFDQAPPHGDGPVGQTLRQMITLESHTREIAELSQNLDAELDQLSAYQDPVFERLRAEVKRLDHPAPDADDSDSTNTATAQLRGLSNGLRPLESFAARFCALVESGGYDQLDHDNFRLNGRAYALLENGTADPIDIFRTWLTERDDYQKVGEDWRVAWAGPQRQALAQLTDAVGPLLAGDHPLSKSLSARVEKLNQRIDAVLDPPLVSGAQTELEREREDIDRDLSELVAAVGVAGQQVDAGELIASLREPAAGLGETRWRSAAVDARWNAERSRLADQLERRGDQVAVEKKLAEVHGQLLALIDPSSEIALPPAPAFTTDTPDALATPMLTALSQHAAAQREAVLKRTLGGVLPVDERIWSKRVADYAQRCAALGVMADETQHALNVVRRALPLNDPALPGNADGEPGFTATVVAWHDRPAWAAVAAAGEPIREQIAYLEAIDREKNPEVLEHLITEAPQPSAAFAAWRRWSALPVSAGSPAASLARAETLQRHMRSRVSAFAAGDAARADELAAEFLESGKQHWLAAFTTASDSKDIAAIADRAPAWKIDADALPAEARFNLMLHHVRGALTQIQDGPRRDAEVLTLTQAFVTGAQAMADHPEVAAVLAALETVADPAADHREHLADAGPAGAGWALVAGDDTRAVTYRRGAWELAFVRIDPPRGPSFYVCTTELPVGLAVDVTDDAKARREWAALLPDAADGDSRKGPRTWTLPTAPGGPAWAVNAGDWLGDDRGYPAGLTPSAPSPRHPVNYLGAEAAAYLAARLGCRLPTIDQWLAAQASHPVPAGQLPNLRDTTWVRHAEHRRALIDSGATGVAWGNSDVFRPVAAAAPDPAGDAHPINDGTLWFDPVPASSPRPMHLVGNLAELVTTQPVDPTPLLDRAVPMPVRRAAFRDRHKNDFAVLGDSALSPASIRPDEPQAYNVFTGARGYADVGVRLVFVAPKLSPARQAHALLKAQPFLRAR